MDARCHQCGKPVTEGGIVAMGKTFHRDHFTCAQCHTSLYNSQFYESDDRAFCASCKGRGPNDYVCTKCNEQITGAIISALGQKWHDRCFVCATCAQPFKDGQFHDYYGKPYCDAHYEITKTSIKRCPTCQNQVDDNNAVIAMGLSFHPSCFRCAQCAAPLGVGAYRGHNNRPYCTHHAPSALACAACNEKIVGSILQAMGKRWHPEHFICSSCRTPLQNKGWKDKNDKPYCMGCFTKAH